jgi:hypothetical protein
MILCKCLGKEENEDFENKIFITRVDANIINGCKIVNAAGKLCLHEHHSNHLYSDVDEN